MIPKTIYKICIRDSSGNEYISRSLTWPALASIRKILDYEIAELQQQARGADNEHQIWQRISQLKRLVDMLLVVKDKEPTMIPYKIPVVLANRTIGFIDAIPETAFEARPPPSN
jgi:hypothetical protein